MEKAAVERMKLFGEMEKKKFDFNVKNVIIEGYVEFSKKDGYREG